MLRRVLAALQLATASPWHAADVCHGPRTCAICLSSATPWYICKWLLWFAALEQSRTASGVFGRQGKLLLMPAVMCRIPEPPWDTVSPLLLASLLVSHWTASLLIAFWTAMSLPAAL